MSAELPPHIQRALARFRAALGERFATRLRELVLFGSWARSEAHEDSDVDVLVVIDCLTERERSEVIDMAYDAAHAGADDEWVSISPLPYSVTQAEELRSRERRLFRDIDAQGVRL